MIFINLMPHRHRRLEVRRRRFAIGLGISVLAACVAVLAASFTLERLHAQQSARNAILEQAQVSMAKQEAQVRQLQAEIAVLQQRQATASSLQLQRNLPVALLNEVTRLAPPGLALTALRQNDLKVAISGTAASNERVSDLMGRLQNESTVLYEAELVEMRSAAPAKPVRPAAGVPAGAGEAEGATERMVEFTLTVMMRREAVGGETRP